MRIIICILCLHVYIGIIPAACEEVDVAVQGFTVSRFDVIGNTKLEDEEIERVLEPYMGLNKTAQDVEKARTALEKYYHQQGYPTALVNIPEQTVEDESVQLKVIESKIRRVRITGNRYFTMEAILKKLPSFRPGEILYLPKVQKELAQVNCHPDLKVAPLLSPGKILGTIDVELKVKDKLPLHGSLELNNRSTHTTSDLRLSGLIHYDNLWQKEHSVSLQYQISPQDTKEVEALALSYVLSAPWNSDHILAIYGVWSDSNIAFGEGFQTVGKGYIVGLRNVIPLPMMENYAHSLSLGVDYKDFKDTLGFQSGEEDIRTPITYLPVSLGYNSTCNHHGGVTRFGLGLNAVFRNLVTEKKEFEDKRFKSRGNYSYATLTVERNQSLPGGFGFFAKGGLQVTDQPLPANEQYLAGGMKSVRGYKEAEMAGDNAIYGTAELFYPNAAGLLRLPGWIEIAPYLFYDIASLKLKDPLPGQYEPETLIGIGAGLRGTITRHLEYEMSWGAAQRGTDQTRTGNQELYFVLKSVF